MTCKKRRYSRQGALYAIVKATSELYSGKKKNDTIPKRSYYCKWCHSYHLTSQLRYDIKKDKWKGAKNRSYGKL